MNKISQNSSKVYLVGAGPGDPGLMTIKGKMILEMADVVIYDALISPDILAMINSQAERICVGKRRGSHSHSQEEITALLIQKAQEKKVIVRLKGGDPFIFGRGGEEMVDLIQSGIATEVVPGVTSGIAAPAYSGIPLTHRDYSSSVTFVTGHQSAGHYRCHVNWRAIAQGSETIVIYMGIHNLASIIEELKNADLPLDTPIALIRWATLPQQQELIGTLSSILEQMQEKKFTAPAIVVIGRTINLHSILASHKD